MEHIVTSKTSLQAITIRFVPPRTHSWSSKKGYTSIVRVGKKIGRENEKKNVCIYAEPISYKVQNLHVRTSHSSEAYMPIA